MIKPTLTFSGREARSKLKHNCKYTVKSTKVTNSKHHLIWPSKENKNTHYSMKEFPNQAKINLFPPPFSIT